MKKILLHISFLGNTYCGYQVQPNAPTVQQKLNEAARLLFGFECDVVGCSRTDSGVHANMFCATVSKKAEDELVTSIPTDKIPQALSFYLPHDISVYHAEWVDSVFHPRYDVKYKEYVYRIWNGKTRNPFEFDRSWHYPRKLDDMAVENMRRAAQRLVGTHDFSSYMAANSTVKSTVRTIYSADVYREGDVICFKISGDGFLYNMVRIMTGTLIAVAEGKIAPEDIDKITQSCNRANAGVTAPPHGLYLNKVVY